ncbi:uncharacterized protein LOC143532845 [Bidens hawaiensis]|uniref:uncharacterized protein LOC143532845 n=1 Tax=Bidens hawaiensis TaxID=980011 RepID=UPI00404A480B
MKRKRSSKKQTAKTLLMKDTQQNEAGFYKSETDEKTSGSIAAMRTETGAQRTASLMIGRNDKGMMEFDTNRLSHMIASVIKEISKEAGGMANLSRSLVDEPVSNGPVAQVPFESHQNAEYKQNELDYALAVIKKTMNLDAAEPFNRPVDPVALDIPDYFDIIKTPMDFGTIRDNLENGVKYKNSADVFKDVENIWHNCVVYNKKGDHILKLMNRVKTFFMKHWIAAKLQTEQTPAIIDIQPGTGSFISRHTNRQNESPLVNNFTQLPEPEAGQPEQSSSQQQSSPEKDESDFDTPYSENTRKKSRFQGLADRQKLLLTAGRIKVLTNDRGQPIGPEAVKLTNFLGHISRDGNMAPLTYSGWSKVPEEYKEKMWQKVLATFDIEPGHRQQMLLSIGSKWRNFKSYLKSSYYDTHETDEERLADRDERVLPDQWSVLVNKWSSKEFQKLSARNKANRAKVKFIHTGGQKSLARLLEEEKEKRGDCQELSQAELLIKTRTRNNRQPMNESTASVIAKLRKPVTPTQDDAFNRLTRVDNNNKGGGSQSDAFNHLMRADNNNKGGGSQSESNGGTIVPSHAAALKMVEAKSVEVDEMKQRLTSMEETCSQMAAQMSAMVSMMANMQKAFVGANAPNNVPLSIPVGTPNQSEPNFTSIHEVPEKPTRGRREALKFFKVAPPGRETESKLNFFLPHRRGREDLHFQPVTPEPSESAGSAMFGKSAPVFVLDDIDSMVSTRSTKKKETVPTTQPMPESSRSKGSKSRKIWDTSDSSLTCDLEFNQIGTVKTNLLDKKTKENEDMKQDRALTKKELVHQEADCLMKVQEVTEGEKRSAAISIFQSRPRMEKEAQDVGLDTPFWDVTAWKKVLAELTGESLEEPGSIRVEKVADEVVKAAVGKVAIDDAAKETEGGEQLGDKGDKEKA